MIAGIVRVTDVRCHRHLEVGLGSGLTVLVGTNGAGKTSVLEAIHLALQGGTPRTAQIRDVIAWGEETLRVEVDITGVDGRLSTAAFGYSASGERRVTADGAPQTNTTRWEEVLPVRMFLPDDVRLVKGSPGRRRRFLDRMALAAEPGYGSHLASYEEALDQRNALLRRGIVGGDHAPWEALLARTGLEVVEGRARTLQTVSGPYVALHAELAPAPDGRERQERPGLVYRTNVAGLSEFEYRERLAESRAADRRRTFTHLGPHRDDLRFTLGGRDLRSYGSQGEHRTALLALLLAERAWISEREGRPPLLLLDDVMSELDDSRRRALVALLRGEGQAVVTTTDLHYFTSEELATMTVIEIGGGVESGG
ncbi:MAG: DNA replication/repair protein RecF [Thermoleophilia bacterium]